MQSIRLPTRDAVQSALARRSLADFTRLSWHVLEPDTPLVWNWHIEVVCNHIQALLEGGIPCRNLMVNVPPGSMKSRIVSVNAPAWQWIRQPSWRAIFFSGNPRVAIRDSLNCRQLIESPWYQRMFRPAWRFARDQNAKMLFQNTAGGKRAAISAGAKVTGDRADALFFDDLLDAADAESKSKRDELIYWYNNGAANRLNDLTSGTRCMIAQRLHEGDPPGHLLASGQWEHLVIRQEYEVPTEKEPAKPTALGWMDPRTKPGELLDPVRFPHSVLIAEKIRLAASGYSGQHQQRPTTAEGTKFKRSFWHYYTQRLGTSPLDLAELKKRLGINTIVIGVDTAMTEKTDADFTAIVVLGVAEARYYVLDFWKEQVESPEAKAAVVMMAAKWGPTAVAIEGGGSHSGKIICQELRRDTRLPIIELPNSTDKITGAAAILPIVSAGAVSLPDDHPMTAGFVDSTAAFPKALHDDDVDAFRHALNYAARGGGSSGWIEFARREAARLEAERKAAAGEA